MPVFPSFALFLCVRERAFSGKSSTSRTARLHGTGQCRIRVCYILRGTVLWGRRCLGFGLAALSWVFDIGQVMINVAEEGMGVGEPELLARAKEIER